MLARTHIATFPAVEFQLKKSVSLLLSRQWLTEGGFGVSPPPPPEIPKALQNRAKLTLIVKTVKHC